MARNFQTKLKTLSILEPNIQAKTTRTVKLTPKKIRDHKTRYGDHTVSNTSYGASKAKEHPLNKSDVVLYSFTMILAVRQYLRNRNL